MDPVTSALNLIGKLLDFGLLVYADTPKELRAQNAADWAMFFHNISAQILRLQAKVNALGDADKTAPKGN